MGSPPDSYLTGALVGGGRLRGRGAPGPIGGFAGFPVAVGTAAFDQGQDLGPRDEQDRQVNRVGRQGVEP